MSYINNAVRCGIRQLEMQTHAAPSSLPISTLGEEGMISLDSNVTVANIDTGLQFSDPQISGTIAPHSNCNLPAAICPELQTGSLEHTNVPQYVILAVTLNLIRSSIDLLMIAAPEYQNIHKFLTDVFPRGGQSDTVHDRMLSSVEVMYR